MHTSPLCFPILGKPGLGGHCWATLYPLAGRAPAPLTVLPSPAQVIWEGQGLLGKHPLIYDCSRATVWSSNVTEAISCLGRAVKHAWLALCPPAALTSAVTLPAQGST